MEETRIIDFEDAYDVETQALPAGTSLFDGKFKVDRQIGAGGFGITYLAKDSYLERPVVIKECFPEAFCFRFGTQVSVSSDRFKTQYRRSVEMFMREARSIAKLRHPNIVTVHQVFEENDTAYMVLDLIDGRDLADIIESGDELLKPDQIHEILVKVLDAIDVVHQHDLLHRDISPDNILLDKWGSPALIDFGAAREDQSQKAGDVSKMLVVKDGYSPHEFYISGGIQGPASDLYALGASMYHLISGEAPPNSQTRVAAMTDGEEDPCEPLADRFPQYERSFLEAIDQAMRVAPRERIQSAREWIALIEQEERKKVKTVSIPESKALSKTLSELIEETNRHVLNAPEKIEQIDKAEAPNPKNSDSFRPAWIEEFNRETLEEAERQRRAQQEAEQAARKEALRRQAEQAKMADRARLEDKAMNSALEVQRQAELEAARPRNILNWAARSRT